MLSCPVNIKDVPKFQEWLEKEGKELVELLENYDPKIHSDAEIEDLRLRHVKFINLWNYDNTVNKKEQYYCCPEAQDAVMPMKCMFCPYGHMAFDCHWPYTCEEGHCERYNQQEQEEYEY